MKWSLQELNKRKHEVIPFSDTIALETSLHKRNPEVLSATPVVVSGTIQATDESYELDYQLHTQLTLPSSRSLEPVLYECDLTVNEIFVTQAQYVAFTAEDNELDVFLLETDSIDLIESIEDNILVSLPFQILTEEERTASVMPAGKDWQIISEDHYQQQKAKKEGNIDPRLAKLSTLLDNDKDSDNE